MDYNKQLKKLQQFRKERAAARKAVNAFLNANPEYKEIEKRNQAKQAEKQQQTKQDIAHMRALLESLKVKENRDRTNAILLERSNQTAKSNPKIRVDDLEAEIASLRSSTFSGKSSSASPASPASAASSASPASPAGMEQELEDFFASEGSAPSDTFGGQSESEAFGTKSGTPGTTGKPGRIDRNAPRTQPIRPLSIFASPYTLEQRSGLKDVEKSKINVAYLSDAKYRAPAFAPIIGNKKYPLLVLMGVASPQLFQQAVRPYSADIKEQISEQDAVKVKLLDAAQKLKAIIASDENAQVLSQSLDLIASGRQGATASKIKLSAAAKIRLDKLKLDLAELNAEILDNENLINRVTKQVELQEPSAKTLADVSKIYDELSKKVKSIKQKDPVRASKFNKRLKALLQLRMEALEADRLTSKNEQLMVKASILQREIKNTLYPVDALQELSQKSQDTTKTSRPVGRTSGSGSNQDAGPATISAKQALEKVKGELDMAEKTLSDLRQRYANPDMSIVNQYLEKAGFTPVVTIKLLQDQFPARARKFAAFTALEAKKQEEYEKASSDAFEDAMRFAEERQGAKKNSLLTGLDNAPFTVLVARSLAKNNPPEFNNSISYRSYVPKVYADWFEWSLGDSVLGFPETDMFLSLKGLKSGGGDDWSWDAAQKGVLADMDVSNAAKITEQSPKLGFQTLNLSLNTSPSTSTSTSTSTNQDNKNLRIILHILKKWQNYNVEGFTSGSLTHKPSVSDYYTLDGKRTLVVFTPLSQTQTQAQTQSQTTNNTFVRAYGKVIAASRTNTVPQPVLTEEELRALLMNPVFSAEGLSFVTKPILIAALKVAKAQPGVIDTSSANVLSTIMLLVSRMKESNLGIAKRMVEILDKPSILNKVAQAFLFNRRSQP